MYKGLLDLLKIVLHGITPTLRFGIVALSVLGVVAVAAFHFASKNPTASPIIGGTFALMAVAILVVVWALARPPQDRP